MDAVQVRTDVLVALGVFSGFCGGLGALAFLMGSFYVGSIFAVFFVLSTVQIAIQVERVERAWRQYLSSSSS